MMKRFLVIAAAALAGLSCAAARRHNTANPYAEPIFYTRYLSTSDPLDQQIQRTLNALRANPDSAPLHNELGQFLTAKGFPKDAETEFERAVNADRRFFPAWYNLGLMRASRNDYAGAGIAFGRTVHYKPGHAAALFQLGLMEEQRGNDESAIGYYTKAISINRNLLDVKINPRILDSKLIHLALIRNYANEHTRESLQFQPTPRGYGANAVPAEPPPVAPPRTQT